MLSFTKRRLGSVVRDQKGFTLIEMLVVVGIIVALAAIIVPLVIAFSGEGEKAGREGERETMQTSIQSMMVKNNLSAVTASDNTTNPKGKKLTNTGTDFHATFNLKDFMDQSASKYCYKWDTTGRVTYQYDVDGTAGACNTELYASP